VRQRTNKNKGNGNKEQRPGNKVNKGKQGTKAKGNRPGKV